MHLKLAIVFCWSFTVLSAQASDSDRLFEGCTALSKLRPDTSTGKAFSAGYCSGAVETAVQALRDMNPMERMRYGVCLLGDEQVKSIFDPVTTATTAAVEEALNDLSTAGHQYAVKHLNANRRAFFYSTREIVRGAFNARNRCLQKQP